MLTIRDGRILAVEEGARLLSSPYSPSHARYHTWKACGLHVKQALLVELLSTEISDTHRPRSTDVAQQFKPIRRFEYARTLANLRQLETVAFQVHGPFAVDLCDRKATHGHRRRSTVESFASGAQLCIGRLWRRDRIDCWHLRSL